MGPRAVSRPPAPALRQRLRHLPVPLAASGALLVAGTVIAGLVRGADAAYGVAAGVALVVASYVLSSFVLAWTDAVNPRLLMPIGLGTYVVKFTIIGLTMAAIAATDWRGLPAMGVAIIAAVLLWTIAQAWWTWRAKIPYVEIDQH